MNKDDLDYDIVNAAQIIIKWCLMEELIDFDEYKKVMSFHCNQIKGKHNLPDDTRVDHLISKVGSEIVKQQNLQWVKIVDPSTQQLTQLAMISNASVEFH